MRNLKYLIFFLLSILALHGSEEDAFRTVESQQIKLWEDNLAIAKSMHPHEKFDALWLGLRNMGTRHSYARRSAEIDSIYARIQQEFLKTEGHAEYFSDQIEKRREQLSSDVSNQWTGDYDRIRWWYLRDTLSHLPSPETIQVLGRYLADERDAPPPPSPGQDWADIPANSFLAAESLSSIGLNDSPIRKGTFVDTGVVEKWRAWYDEVKTGQRSFSFRGENVSYRFKADGTVETTPRNASKDRPAPPDPQSNGTTADPRWTVSAIIAGALVMMVLIAAYLWRKRFKGNA